MTRFALVLLFLTSCVLAQNQKKALYLFFETNDFAVNPASQETLTTFFSNDKITVASIAITGFCDDIGESNDNKILSDKRARSVADYLYQNFKLASDVVSGKGEIAVVPTDENIDSIRKNNRKVIVIVSFSEKILQDTKPTSKVSKRYKNNKSFDEKLKVGDHVILENLIFKSSTTTFENKEIAEKELAKIAQFLVDNPTAKIEIEGHVCCISKSFPDARDINSGKNNLSETRAKKIYDVLISKGFAKERLSYVGYGRQYPLKDTKEDLNKRVEIVVLAL